MITRNSLLFAGVVLCVLVCGFLVVKMVIENSMHRADCIEITENFRRWVEAGSPQGEDLINFLKGRRSDLVFSNRMFSIGGTNYVTQFAVTNPHSHRAGVLFVTTNQILIWQDASGRAQVQ